jgi:hypothetical protein
MPFQYCAPIDGLHRAVASSSASWQSPQNPTFFNWTEGAFVPRGAAFQILDNTDATLYEATVSIAA